MSVSEDYVWTWTYIRDIILGAQCSVQSLARHQSRRISVERIWDRSIIRVSNKCNTKDTFVLEWNQGQERSTNKCPNTTICQNASHKLARQIEKLEDWVQPRLKPFEMPVRVQLDRKRASNKSSFKYEGDYPIKWKFQKVPGHFFLACPCLPEHWNRCH